MSNEDTEVGGNNSAEEWELDELEFDDELEEDDEDLELFDIDDEDLEEFYDEEFDEQA